MVISGLFRKWERRVEAQDHCEHPKEVGLNLLGR